MKRMALASILLACASVAPAAPADDARSAAQALEVLKRSIGFRTVLGTGQVPAYAEYLADVLRAGGFAPGDISIDRHGETATLVARYRGTGSGPALLLAGHMDVVGADPADWTRDPFTAVVEKGYVFGRGAVDNKLGIATMVAALVRLKADGFRPARDVVLALSGDEETSQATTAVLAQKLKGATLLLNSDAGGAALAEDGRPLYYGLQAAEKTYADFKLTVTNPGGHSSRPTASNAIYELARALDRIAATRFPAQASPLTRAFLTATAKRTPGGLGAAMARFAANPGDAAAAATLAADPEYVGQIGTTCVPTQLAAGHAPNALPQRATANVNCRIFPGVAIEDVRAKLQAAAGRGVTVELVGTPLASAESPLRDDVLAALRKGGDQRSPGLPIVPQMSAGTTDSLYFRAVGVPSYGVGGAFMKSSDDFAHGLNERVPVESVGGSVAMWRVLITELAR